MRLEQTDKGFRLVDIEDASVLRSGFSWATANPDDLAGLIRILHQAQILMRRNLELEPCPACGARDDLRYKRDDVGRYYVECPCGMRSVLREMTVSRMVTAWNNQAREIIRKREEET